MNILRASRRALSGIVAMGLLLAAGCLNGSIGSNYTVVTEIDGRSISAHSTSTNALALKATGKAAEITVNGFTFIVDSKQVSWEPDKHLALPAGWKKLEFEDGGKRVAVRVDGKPFGEIDPAI